MIRKKYILLIRLKLTHVLCLFVALAAFVRGPLDAQERPNVLFILVDDLRPELGCYGAPVETPNIDRLAGVSTRFDRAYCQYPLCNPSRTSLLTGLYPTETGVLDNTLYFRDKFPDHVTLPQLFKNNGYTTVRCGKVFHGGIDDAVSWSEGSDEQAPKNPNAAGLTREEAARRATLRAAQRSEGPLTKPKGPITDKIRNSDQRIILAEDGQSHMDYRTTELAMEAMERLKDKPFFITCGFTKPHSPPSAPQRYYDLYPTEKIQLPVDFSAYPKAPKASQPHPFPRPALICSGTAKQHLRKQS